MQDNQNNATWQKDARMIRGEAEIVNQREIIVNAVKPTVEYIGKADKSGIKCSGIMGLFVKGQTVDFTVDAENLSCIKYTVRNTLSGETVKGEVETDHSSGSFRLDFTRLSLKAGHYQLTLDAGADFKAYFAIVNENKGKFFDSPFGVDHASAWHVDREKREAYASLIDALGVCWVRERIRIKDVFTPDGYRFEEYDHAFKCLKQKGVKISVTFHDYPEEISKICRMGDSLKQVRDIAYNIGKHFKDTVDAWEIWNEQDVTYFTGGTPDEYSAFLKAFAIGLEDSGASCLRVLGAFARIPQRSDYGRCMMKNGLMDYVQVYNFHTYVFPDKSAAPALDEDATAKHMANCRDNMNKAAWLTETGAIIMRPEDQGTLLKNYQCARYTATAPVAAAYRGVDKIFPFMLPGYYEGGVGFGMMSDEETILPEYTALSSLCYNLGECRILGKTTLEADGYAVSTGKDEVLMLWSDRDREICLPCEPVFVSDMNGGQEQMACENGVITITVGVMPKYLHFEKIPQSLYNKEQIRTVRPKQESIAQKDRLIIKAVFPSENFPYFPNPHKGEGEVLQSGYLLNKGENAVILKCCNLTDADAVARVGCDSEGASLGSDITVSLKAGEEKDVQATVIFNNDCDMSLYLIKDGEKCSNNYFTLNEKTK